MSKNTDPAGRGEAEMIADERLDRLLDAVAAPAPSAALRSRLYNLGAGARPASLWSRLGDWFKTGPVLRPVGGMAAMACSLLIGVAVGYALPDGAAPDAARPLPVIALPAAFEPPLVVAGLADPLTIIEGINLVAPPASQPAAEPDAPAENDDIDGLPLY